MELHQSDADDLLAQQAYLAAQRRQTAAILLGLPVDVKNARRRARFRKSFLRSLAQIDQLEARLADEAAELHNYLRSREFGGG